MVWRSGSSAPSRSRSCGAGFSAMPRRFAPRSGPSSRAITSTGCWRRMPTAALLRPGANGSPHSPQSGRPHSSILCPENPGRYTPMLRIITFATQKGGAGKTTLATSFAVAAAEAGETVVLFDLDFQQSVMAWREARQQPKSTSNPNPVRVPNRPIVEPYPADKLPMMSRMLKSLEGKGVTLVVLDTPGAANATVNAALAASDFVVIPLAPTRIDLGAVRPTVQAVMRTSSKFGFVLNNCPPQPNNPRPEKMATGLSTIGPVAPVRIVRRADYQDAYAEGKGVTEWAPDSPAAQEVRQLLQWINEQTKGQSLEQAPSLAIGF